MNKEVKRRFLERLGSGNITREENPIDHFCVFFAVYDPKNRMVCMFDHKKAGLWLFSGGHLDGGENPYTAVLREIGEEFGEVEFDKESVQKPLLLTIIDIDNPPQVCRRHYDIWYFMKVDKDMFEPNVENVAKEYNEMRWVSLEEARKLKTSSETLEALSIIETKFGI